MPFAAWAWIRSGRRRWMLAAFGAGVVAQAAWLREVAAGGLSAILRPDAGLNAWGAWSLGVAGLVALVSGLGSVLRSGREGLLHPDRALEIAIGFFGVGVLLQRIALALS